MTEDEYLQELAEASYKEYLKEEQTEAPRATVKQQRELYHSKEGELYGSKMFYVHAPRSGRDYYLRNDGKLFSYMAETAIDLDGATYFLTFQEAQDCLDRYNAAKDAANQDT